MLVKKLRKTLMIPLEAKGRGKESGMTIIEILIVIALMGVVMTLVVSNLTDTQDQAMRDATRLGMGQLDSNLQMYKIHNFRYPTTEQGLQALVTKPSSGATRWRGPYAEESKIRDAWDNPYEYSAEGKSFKIISPGPDGIVGNEDDVVYPEESGEEEG